MHAMVERLRTSELFAKVPGEVVAGILADATVVDARPGQPVDIAPIDYLVLLEGAVDLARRQDGVHFASFAVPAGSTAPAWIYAVTPTSVIRVIRPSRYVVLDGERLERALHANQEAALTSDKPPAVIARADWLRRFPPFLDLTRNEVIACAEAAESITVPAGSDVVRQGQPGNYLYVIESGDAEVWRSGPTFGPKPIRIATLGPGAAFGEEALLQDAARNATVRAKTECRLLRFDRITFDRWLRNRLVQEIDPVEAHRRVEDGQAVLIDCRYEMEHLLAHIPGSRLLPLDQLRERIRGYDPNRSYIVYCRSGTRSRAATYIMRLAGLQADVLRGGLIAWPYEIDGRLEGPLSKPPAAADDAE